MCDSLGYKQENLSERPYTKRKLLEGLGALTEGQPNTLEVDRNQGIGR